MVATLNTTTIPRASILVPARNEQENIAACVESLLAQGDEFEIIVADDASEDRTAEIVGEMAARGGSQGRLRLIRVPALPAGWLGKNHALHFAAQQARGKWLLFTDADTRHAPGKLGEVIARAEREDIALLSYSPEQITVTWWERAVIPIIYDLLAQLYDFHRVNDPADAQAAANGQYILMRRDAYDAVGGHEAIRGEVLEDVLLARRVKQSDRRIWFGSGTGVVQTRMYRRFGDMWEGWTKNLFLLFGRNRYAIKYAALRLALRSWVPSLYVAIQLGLLVWDIHYSAYIPFNEYIMKSTIAACWTGSCALRHGITHRRIPLALHYPVGAPIVFLLLLTSYWRYSRNLGIAWKGRRYGGPRTG